MDGAVATILGLDGVVIHARDVHLCAKEIVGEVLADGLVDVGFRVGMHHDGHADILGGDAIADGTCVGGCADGRCGHGILDVGVVQCVGWCPAVGVVARAARGSGVQSGGFAFAEFILVGGGQGSHVGAFHAHRDLCGAAATALWVGDGDGIGLGGLQRHGLGGLCIGVDHHVGGLPMEVESSRGTCTGREGRSSTIDDSAG